MKQAAPDGRCRNRRSAPRSGLHSALLLVAIWLGVAGLTWLGGCAAETRYRVLSTFFDGVPPPGTPPVERRGRRATREKPKAPGPEDVSLEDLELAELAASQPAPVAEYETYADVLVAFPKDSMGNVDWVAAVEKALIRPLPGLDPEATEFPILPYDVRLDPGIPGFEVVFPHAAHTYWLRCDNCHPAIFRMQAGSNPITMAKIFEGEYCGKCHGKVAFPPQTGCLRCHVNLGGG